jgi:TrmH family RNA methyltransferase
VPRFRLTGKLFAGLTELATATAVFAEIAITEPEKDAYTTIVLLDRIQDPGNVGALLRTAAAAGVEAVHASRGCVDLWSPKVLRAGMGAHFRLTLREPADLAAVGAGFAGKICCTGLAGNSIYDADLRGPTAWLFGNEGSGIASELASLCAERLTIPMNDGVESLNVATAAAVCLFEQRRQRRYQRKD